MNTHSDDADLLHGVPAIADFLTLTPRQVYYLKDARGLPLFKIGERVCGRRSTLRAWLDEQEAKGAGLEGKSDA